MCIWRIAGQYKTSTEVDNCTASDFQATPHCQRNYASWTHSLYACWAENMANLWRREEGCRKVLKFVIFVFVSMCYSSNIKYWLSYLLLVGTCNWLIQLFRNLHVSLMAICHTHTYLYAADLLKYCCSASEYPAQLTEHA